MIVKSADGRFLCFEHYQQSRAGESEIELLIREYFENNLEYVDEVYKKKIRILLGEIKEK